MKHVLLLLFFALGLGLARAEDAPKPPDPNAPNILVALQMVTLPRATALPIIRDLLDPAKVEDGVTRAQRLLDEGTAKLAGWPMVTIQNGNRGTIESIDEFRYATDYEPSAVNFSVADGKAKVDPSPLGGEEFLAIPTQFMTENLGVSLEVEPTICSDGQHLFMNLMPQHARLKSMNKVTVTHEKTGEKASVEQPEIDRMKTTTALTVKSGQHLLLGVYTPPEPADTLELFILRAVIQPTP